MTDCNTISISRGSDWTVSLNFKDETDNPIDYMGASLSAEILSNSNESVIATPVSAWSNAPEGEASLSLSETETMDVPAGVLSRLRITTVTSSGTTIRVRDGAGTPIKTFETTGTLGSAGGSTTVIRTSDE